MPAVSKGNSYNAPIREDSKNLRVALLQKISLEGENILWYRNILTITYSSVSEDMTSVWCH